MDEEYWKRYRERARRRAAAQMMVFLGPLILLGLVVKVLAPQDYPAGDARSDPSFWLAFGIAMAVPVLAATVLSIRLLTERQPAE